MFSNLFYLYFISHLTNIRVIENILFALVSENSPNSDAIIIKWITFCSHVFTTY